MQPAPPERKSGPTPSALAYLALLVGNVVLALGTWLVRLSVDEGGVGPVAASFWRLALGAPMLLLLVGATRQPVPRLSRGMWIGIGIGGLFFAADLAAWHVGILGTKLANAALFGNITSFIFAGYGFLIARTWPSRGQSVALILAGAGVTLLLGRSYELSDENLVGDLLCILAGLLYTGYLISIARARRLLAPLPVVAVSTLAGILPLLLLAWAMGDAILPRDWTPLLLLALGSQVVGQGTTAYAIGHLSPVVIGLGLLIQPAVAAATGWLAYGETLGALDWLGAAAIAVALVLVARAEPRRSGPSPETPAALS